jgi:hypothetical protein
MNAEAKARWVADLRSGKYEQNRGTFVDGKKMCCLTVLAVGQAPSFFKNDGHILLYDGRDAGAFGVIDRLIQVFGLTQEEVNDAIGMNDNEGFSFQEIADRVEQEWP